ncbi:hypothetical protein F5X71_24020 [Nocardia brasiliensis]|uniref:MarR family transcriptional regulator n=1 Tax=Nocardia brasiliensis TaxID=37326 RepID=A0A6G9XVU8_NOCBR|nr:hypothetical protein [Nocardia brasiliensis]QIS04980.1 hypothetical protein F5X71_24020 [Nocardia brasiliensis]
MTASDLFTSTRLPILGRAATQQVVRELTAPAADPRTGSLRVTGDPGGTFEVIRGRVADVRSPGAPGVPELLTRPGRRDIGDAELRAVTMLAAVDGAFAIAAGWIERCSWDRGDDDMPGDGAHLEPDWLLTETERRLCALSHGRVSPHRNRLLPTALGTSLRAEGASGLRQEILRQVNGERSCRDIAFLLCRSLYAVSVEVSRMLAEDLLVVPPPRHDASGPNPAPRSGMKALPRRRRGASGINDMLPPRAPQAVHPATPRRGTATSDVTVHKPPKAESEGKQ